MNSIGKVSKNQSHPLCQHDQTAIDAKKQESKEEPETKTHSPQTQHGGSPSTFSRTDSSRRSNAHGTRTKDRQVKIRTSEGRFPNMRDGRVRGRASFWIKRKPRVVARKKSNVSDQLLPFRGSLECTHFKAHDDPKRTKPD